MQKIAAFIVKKRRLLLVVMLALAVVCAALMPFVGINTDMTKYLPDSSQMKIGMDRMNEAFPDVAETYTIRVMFRGLDARDKLAIREQLAEIPNVDSVAYEPDSGDYNRGDATLYKLTTQYDYNSDEEAQIERDVADRFDGYDVAVRSDDTSTPDIPPIVFILSIVLVTTILLIACPSYFEPVLFLITIGIAVLINQGTNIFLGETSDVTASISAILQLALSMDYSIILMNRYRQELQADPDREAAMTRALAAAFGSITGSSVTTIVGLLMLVFMRFKIGMDLGIVLAKGVLCSLLCVFTVLPGLILWADKLVRKTTKKPRAPKRERRSVLAALGRFSYRWRGAIAAAFVLLFAGTYILQLSTQIAYTLTDADPVAEVFPPDNPIVVLYNNADEDAVAALAEYEPPLILMDLGTATTIEVVDRGSTYLGGCIIPGVRTSLDALTSRAAQLPGIRLDRPGRVIGKNTVDCMRSGIMYGTAAMLDGMLDRVEEELGSRATVVATGGMAQFIVPLCRREIKLEKDLLLKGLNIIYQKNAAKRGGR